MHGQSEGVFDITVAPVLQKFGLLPRHETDVGARKSRRRLVRPSSCCLDIASGSIIRE